MSALPRPHHSISRVAARLGVVLALLAIAAMPAPAWADAKKVDTVGEWLVMCDAGNPGDPPVCFLATPVTTAADFTNILYIPTQRRLVVVDKNHDVQMVARVDNDAPRAGVCQSRGHCEIEDPAFAQSIERGTTLTVVLSGGRPSVVARKSLADLRRGMEIARRWINPASDAAPPPSGPLTSPKPAPQPRQATPPSAAPPLAPAPAAPPAAPGNGRSNTNYGAWILSCTPKADVPCIINAHFMWDDTAIVVFFIPSQASPAFGVAMEDEMNFTATARIDNGASYDMKIQDRLAFVARREFYGLLSRGATVALRITAPGRQPWIASVSLSDLRQALAGADRWQAQNR